MSRRKSIGESGVDSFSFFMCDGESVDLMLSATSIGVDMFPGTAAAIVRGREAVILVLATVVVAATAAAAAVVDGVLPTERGRNLLLRPVDTLFLS